MTDLTSFIVFFALWVSQNAMMSYIMKTEVDESDYPGTSIIIRYMLASYLGSIG